jgi:hypothetical protein
MIGLLTLFPMWLTSFFEADNYPLVTMIKSAKKVVKQALRFIDFANTTSATFVGYLMGGWPSALLATLAFFLPSFFFVALVSRILPWLRKSWWSGAFLDGVNVASLGLMVGVT